MRWKDFQLFEKNKSTSVYFFLKSFGIQHKYKKYFRSKCDVLYTVIYKIWFNKKGHVMK